MERSERSFYFMQRLPLHIYIYILFYIVFSEGLK